MDEAAIDCMVNLERKRGSTMTDGWRERGHLCHCCPASTTAAPPPLLLPRCLRCCPAAAAATTTAVAATVGRRCRSLLSVIVVSYRLVGRCRQLSLVVGCQSSWLELEGRWERRDHRSRGRGGKRTFTEVRRACAVLLNLCVKSTLWLWVIVMRRATGRGRCTFHGQGNRQRRACWWG